jgi:SAM-dependent methyltransferase
MENRFPLDQEVGLPIQVECTDVQLYELTSRVERAWERMGRSDPYFSVCTDPIFHKDHFGSYQDMFWESGRVAVDRMRAWAKRNGVDTSFGRTCLEYGCGAGRVTRWLADEFYKVIACDISPAYLDLARKSLADHQHRVNVQFAHIQIVSDIFALPTFDLLFSIIVLQHNPPPVIAKIIKALLERLNIGGIAYFQVPTFIRNYTFDCQAYLDDPARGSGMEMHCIPQRYVFEIVRKTGCRVLEVEQDDLTGCLDHVSTTFLITK